MHKLIPLLLLLFPSLLSSHFYKLDRLAFPALCEKHYSDLRKYTSQTWIEPCDEESLKELKPYLRYLPLPYEADCYGCSGCGGMRISRHDEVSLPLQNVLFAYAELTKLHQQVRYGTLETCRQRNTERCEPLSWDGGYFRRLNQRYFPFFKEYLIYCSQNEMCKCLWPERRQKTAAINNSVYRVIHSLIEQKLIRTDFSTYWISKEISFGRKGRSFGKEYFPSSHGMASSLTTYTFFYSQYRQMLGDVMAAIEVNAGDPLQIIVAKDQVYHLLEEVREQFLILYTQCLKAHPHPKIYLERSLLRSQSGEMQEALADLLLANSKIVSSANYQQLGEIYVSLGDYSQALEALSRSLELDPSNLEAYFQRAVAHFELGQFDKSLEDYSHSKKRLAQVPAKASAEYKEGLLRGLKNVEALPLDRSPYGLQKALWAFEELALPEDVLQSFANACEEMGLGFSQLLQANGEIASEELRDLFTAYPHLGDSEKGEKIGAALGKTSILLFDGTHSIKLVEAFKKLRQANYLGNFSALENQREALIALAQRFSFAKKAEETLPEEKGEHVYDDQQSEDA